VLVLFEALDGRLIRIRGIARYLTDADTMRRVVRAALPKYYLRPRALWLALRKLARLRAMLRYYGERTDSGIIEVTPESLEIDSASSF
jgi:hypothetical protein